MPKKTVESWAGAVALAELGTMSDGDWGRRWGCTPPTATNIRARRGIPPFGRFGGRGPNWTTEEVDAACQPISNEEVARITGRPVGSVITKRRALDIPQCTAKRRAPDIPEGKKIVGKTISMSEDDWELLDNLPDLYGKNRSAKMRCALHVLASL